MIWPFQVDVWAEDPMPLHLSSYVRWSAEYWRAVTKATLQARRAS